MLLFFIVLAVLFYVGVGGLEDGGYEDVRVGRFGGFLVDAVGELEMARKYIGVEDIKAHE